MIFLRQAALFPRSRFRLPVSLNKIVRMMILKSKFRWSVFSSVVLSAMAFAQIASADEAVHDELLTPPAMSAAGTAPSANIINTVADTSDIIVLSPRADLTAPVAAPSEKSGKAAKKTPSRNQAKASKSQDSEVSVLGGLYGYVDDMGVPHYALQKLDDR